MLVEDVLLATAVPMPPSDWSITAKSSRASAGPWIWRRRQKKMAKPGQFNDFLHALVKGIDTYIEVDARRPASSFRLPSFGY